jgi:hypothetical protein
MERGPQRRVARQRRSPTGGPHADRLPSGGVAEAANIGSSGIELGAIADRLLEVVADDLIEINQLGTMYFARQRTVDGVGLCIAFGRARGAARRGSAGACAEAVLGRNCPRSGLTTPAHERGEARRLVSPGECAWTHLAKDLAWIAPHPEHARPAGSS